MGNTLPHKSICPPGLLAANTDLDTLSLSLCNKNKEGCWESAKHHVFKTVQKKKKLLKSCVCLWERDWESAAQFKVSLWPNTESGCKQAARLNCAPRGWKWAYAHKQRKRKREKGEREREWSTTWALHSLHFFMHIHHKHLPLPYPFLHSCSLFPSLLISLSIYLLSFSLVFPFFLSLPPFPSLSLSKNVSLRLAQSEEGGGPWTCFSPSVVVTVAKTQGYSCRWERGSLCVNLCASHTL